MQYHLVLTQRCNLQCDYCGSTVEPTIMPVDLDYNLTQLDKFFSKLDQPPVIAFYGGEPLVNHHKMMEIMDRFPHSDFMLQTNGTLLHRLTENYIKKLHSVLISVDGRPDLTNLNRGESTYRRAIEGAKHLVSSGFAGDLLARMTVTQFSDIYQEVVFLLNSNNPKFNHVHWQLDVMWDNNFDENQVAIEEWLLHRYNPGITKLVDYWIEYMENHHQILGIVPFLGITSTLLTKSTIVKPRCGAGVDFFSVTTDGRVTICPILPSVSFAVVGDIASSDPNDLSNTILLEEPCLSCNVVEICGGRCTYANKTKYWGDRGFNLVCLTIRHLINELQRILPRIKNLIEHGNISEDQFNYPKVPNGVEIIP